MHISCHCGVYCYMHTNGHITPPYPYVHLVCNYYYYYHLERRLSADSTFTPEQLKTELTATWLP